MATAIPGKCPRCDCEGNRVACEMCFYWRFKCPGNCLCCADQKESSTETHASASSGIVPRKSTQQQARANKSNEQSESTQQQARASKSNDQTESTQKQKRTPLKPRPLILRNVKKALSDNQKAACSNVSQSKAENSKVSESCTNQVNPTVGESNENKVNLEESKLSSNKVNSEVKETNSNKVNQPKVKEPKKVKVDAETQTSPQKVTNVVETELPAARKESETRENEELMRLWNGLFWPQYDRVPCAPPPPNENRRKSNILTKEELEEGINNLIGDQCLNCHCSGRSREPCDICKRTDFQCLGSCLCCSSFRANQRKMILVTRCVYQLPDGSFYGGINNLSNVVPHISEMWRAITATAISAFSEVIFIPLNIFTTLLSGMLMNMRQALLSYF